MQSTALQLKTQVSLNRRHSLSNNTAPHLSNRNLNIPHPDNVKSNVTSKGIWH
jgi:hypothetical protein